MTRSGDVVGTPAYMSPEQVRGERSGVGHPTDIYSLGATLHVMLLFEPPFPAREQREMLQHILYRDTPTLRSRDPRIPTDLETIVLKCLDKDPRHRYATAEALGQDLRRFARGDPIEARPQTTWERVVRRLRRHRAAVAVACGALLMLSVISVGFGVAMWRSQQRTSELLDDNKALLDRNSRVLARAQIDEGLRRLHEDDPAGLLHLLTAHQTARDIPEVREAAARLWAVGDQLYGEEPLQALDAGSAIHSIAFSPDGTLVATGTRGEFDQKSGRYRGLAQVWNVRTGEPHGPPLVHEDKVYAVAFSPDGKLLATGSKDGEDRGKARLWRTDTGELHCEPMPHDGWVYSLKFSPDASLLLTATGRTLCADAVGRGSDNAARLWDTSTGKLRGPMLRHDGPVVDVAFSPQGEWVATASLDGTARIWDSRSGAPITKVSHQGAVYSVSFSPDRRVLATGSADGASLWDTRSWERRLAPTLSGGLAILSPDARLLATTTMRTGHTSIRLLDSATGEPWCSPTDHGGWIHAMSFDAQGRFLGLAGKNGAQLVLIREHRIHVHRLPLEHGHQVFSTAFSPNGRVFVTGSNDGIARLWSTASIDASFPIGPACRTVAFHPGGELLATGGENGIVDLWKLSPWSGDFPVESLQSGIGAVRDIAFSPRGEWLAAATNASGVKLWKWGRGGFRDVPLTSTDDEPALGRANAVAFDASGAYLAARYDDRIRVFTIASGTYRKLMASPVAPRDSPGVLAFLPKSSHLLVTRRVDEYLECLDTEAGQLDLYRLQFSDVLQRMDVSRDGGLLAIVSLAWVQVVETWSGAPRTERLSLPRTGVRCVRLSPDGAWFSTASRADARLWCLSLGPDCPYISLPSDGEIPADLDFSPDAQLIAVATDQGVSLWPVPRPPDDVREMQLRTWVKLGVHQSDEGTRGPIPSEEWRRLRDELRELEREHARHSVGCLPAWPDRVARYRR